MNQSNYMELANIMEEQHGCSDKIVTEKCARQALDASDILLTYNELITYALALYQAYMWGRKQYHVEKKPKEDRHTADISIQSAPKSFDFLRMGGLIFRRKK